MRAILTTTLSLAALLCTCGLAPAQGFAYQRPPVSPYLNLLRRGSDPAINYYDLVRPQIDQQAFNQQFYERQQQQGALIQGLEEAQAGQPAGVPRFPTTGHPTQVMSHMRYFQTRGPAAGPAGAGPGQGVPTFANRPIAPARPGAGVNPPPPRGEPTIR